MNKQKKAFVTVHVVNIDLLVLTCSKQNFTGQFHLFGGATVDGSKIRVQSSPDICLKN